MNAAESTRPALYIPNAYTSLDGLTSLVECAIISIAAGAGENGAEVTNAQLSQTLLASARTVQRALARLRELGYVIDAEDPATGRRRLYASDSMRSLLGGRQNDVPLILGNGATVAVNEPSDAPDNTGSLLGSLLGGRQNDVPPITEQRKHADLALLGGRQNGAPQEHGGGPCLYNKNSNTYTGDSTLERETRARGRGVDPFNFGLPARAPEPETIESVARTAGFPADRLDILQAWSDIHDGELPRKLDVKYLGELLTERGGDLLARGIRGLGEIRGRSISKLREVLEKLDPQTQALTKHETRTGTNGVGAVDWQDAARLEAERQAARRRRRDAGS